MSLIIEDGSKVDNSDSYVSRADYIAHALTLGVTIADADAADVQLRQAAIYIGQHEANLKGDTVSRDQSMAYPRYNLWINGWSWSSDEIPTEVIDCQLAFALDINGGEDLWNRSVNPNAVVKKQRVEGAVSREFAVNERGVNPTKKSTGDPLLYPLLVNVGSMSMPAVRS